MMINSNKPGKVSVMLISRVVKPYDSKDTLKSCVRMKIQQSKGDVYAKYLIEKMSKFEFCRIENIYKLKHQLKKFVYFFSISP